jgi:hypothetical protein
MREKDTMHTTTSFNLVLNNLFNQLIPDFIRLLELHRKPVKNEAGTHQGQNKSSGRGVKTGGRGRISRRFRSQMMRAKRKYSSLRHFRDGE